MVASSEREMNKSESRSEPIGDSSPVFTTFVDGEAFVASGKSVPVINPANGKVWATAYIDGKLVHSAVQSASAAFTHGPWRAFTAAERAALLRNLANLIVGEAEQIAALESLANGKTVVATRAEIKATAEWYRYYASVLETWQSHQRELSATSDAHIVREPLGVVVAITPFNGAFSLGSWKIAPALAMGNTVVVKPPPEASASTIRLAQLALKAGFPKGVLNVLIGDAEIGQALISHDSVAMVSFTGSTAAARKIGEQVSGKLKRFVCEAGGKSAHIIFEDADLQSAVIAATQGVFSASGQTCVAGSRILVHSSIFHEFVDLYLASIRRLRLGDPASPSTHLGPIASSKQLARIQRLIDNAVVQGASILIGGTDAAIEGEGKGGFWFNPTVLTNVGPDAEIWQEEVFGPVAVLHAFETEDEAISLANSSPYGLAAGFWTRDVNRIRRVSRQLQAGTVWVNTYRAINVRVPFGGYKQSGIGRENGTEALDEFSQIKSVVIEYGPAKDPFGT